MVATQNTFSSISASIREERLVTLRNAASIIACECLALVFPAAFLHAQSHESKPLTATMERAPGSVIRSDVKLALVNVSVSDPFERSVVGLEQENFRVLEDGIEQEVISFSSEDVPISVGIIADVSGSMKNDIEKVREGVQAFVKTANAQDEFFLVTFGAYVKLASPFTTEVDGLPALIPYPSGSNRLCTSLLDAIYFGLSQVRSAHYRKRALLILSDGGDNFSRHSPKQIKQMVREADTEIYAVGIYDPPMFHRSPEGLNGPSLLSEITEPTGGHVYPVERTENLPAIAAKIGRELRNQYILGYIPSNHLYDSKWRGIKVRLRFLPRGLPPLTVHFKTGYFATP